jgi:hypothetical protein
MKFDNIVVNGVAYGELKRIQKETIEVYFKAQ